MGFANKQETTVKPTEASDDEALLARIAFLGEKKSELEQSVAEHAALSFDVDALLRAKSDAIAELDSVKAETLRISEELSARKEELESLVSRTLASRLELERVSVEITNAHEKALESARVARELEEKIASLVSIANELDASTAKKKELLESTMVEISDLRREFQKMTEDAQSRKSRDEEEARSLATSLSDWQSAIQDAESLFGKIQERIASARTEAEEVLAAAEGKASEILARATKREEELVVREGEVSVREAFLVEKTDQLKKVKADLEQYYNRTITHIKF